MRNSSKEKERKGQVLLDNYWIDESILEEYIANRKKATDKAIAAMLNFCATVNKEWAGSEDGEAVVGYDENGNIRSVIHLDPLSIKKILSMKKKELIDFLK